MSRARLRRRLQQLAAGVPLPVRVALIVGPAILAVQILMLRLMFNAHPSVDVMMPQHRYQLLPPRIPGEAPPPPLLRMNVPNQEVFVPIPEERAALLGETSGGLWTGLPSTMPFGGRVLPMRLRPPQPPWQSIATVLVVISLLVWAGLAWVMRPLAQMARAAEALGRDVHQAPLAEQGPPEVRRAAAAFNRMQDRLLRFLRGRADAMLAMSHDLKTPITRLQLRAELLPDELRASFIDDISLLQRRVDEALAFMRGVHNDEPLTEVDFDALVATLVERMQDGGADLQLRGSVQPLRCRPTQIERVLANLIDNALQYAGHAEVELEDIDDQLHLRVLDQGPGVPDVALPRLAEPFYRVDSSRSRERGGTGLGLAIAKDLVEAMGGVLVLRNRSPQGFEASLSLPRT